MRTRAKRKKSRPSESEKTNDSNAQQSEESDEDEKEFHDEKRCFTCRKTFSRMAEDLVHVLCDSCQHVSFTKYGRFLEEKDLPNGKFF